MQFCTYKTQNLRFFRKSEKTVKIMAFSRVLCREDSYMRSCDFGHKYSVIYLKFSDDNAETKMTAPFDDLDRL